MLLDAHGNHVTAVCRFCPFECLFKLIDGFNLFSQSPHAFGVLDKINVFDAFHFGIRNLVIEGNTPLEILEPVDHRKSTVVTNNDDQFMSSENGTINVTVHHQVGSITDENDYITVWVCHFRPPASSDFIAHAGKAEFTVKCSRGFSFPVFTKFSGKTSCCSQRQIGFITDTVDGANHMSITRGNISCWTRMLFHGSVPFGI